VLLDGSVVLWRVVVGSQKLDQTARAVQVGSHFGCASCKELAGRQPDNGSAVDFDVDLVTKRAAVVGRGFNVNTTG
jgi:hypothetical protein